MSHHATDERIWKNLRDGFPHPYREVDFAGFLANVAAPATGNLVLGIEVDGAAVGAIGVHPKTDVYRRGAELGYWLGVPFHGRGIVTAAVKAMATHAFTTFPELVRLEAAVFSWNEASSRVLEKSGFALEGVLRSAVFKAGQLLDARLYARLRDDVLS